MTADPSFQTRPWQARVAIMAIKRQAPTSAARNLRPGLVLLPGPRRHPGLVLLPGARRHLRNRKPEEGGSGLGFLGRQRPGRGYLPSALGAGFREVAIGGSTPENKSSNHGYLTEHREGP